MKWLEKYLRLLLERLILKCKTKPCFYRLFMSGQESHLEELYLLEKLKTHLKESKPFWRVTSLDFSETNTGNRLPNKCNRLHKAFEWKDVTLHIWIWISTFKGTGNRLPKHCNRLQLFEINWNVVNSVDSFLKTILLSNRLQQSVNQLPESKNSLVNMFWEKSMCYSVFEKTFSYLSWLSLLLILESCVLNLDLDSWNL